MLKFKYRRKTSLVYGEFLDGKVDIIINSDKSNKVTAFYFTKEVIEKIEGESDLLKEKYL